MSWFFGKKKHKESPSDSAEETSTSSQPDEYIIVERQANPFDPDIASIRNGGSDGGAGGSGLYPYLNNIMTNPPTLPSSTSSSSSFGQSQDILGDTQTYLSAVKFQLSKQFNDNNNEIDRIHIDEIFSYLLRIQNNEYDYDFSLEKSVIAEMEAAAE